MTLPSVMAVADIIQYHRITNADEALMCAFHRYSIPARIPLRARSKNAAVIRAQHAALVAVAYQRKHEGINHLAREFERDHTTIRYILDRYSPYGDHKFKRVHLSPELLAERAQAMKRVFPVGRFAR